MHKKILLLLILTFCGLYAQEGLNEMRIVGKPELLQSEFISSKNKDINGNVCAGLKIVTDLTGFSYRSNNGIVKIDKEPGRDVLYLSPDERVVEVYCTGFKPLKIYLYETGISLESRAVWKVEVTGDKKTDKIPVNIIVNPSDARIYINDELQQEGPTFQLSAGSHELRIEKDNYGTISEKIEVSATSTLFNYTLEPVEQVPALFKSTPKGASIFVNNFDKGVTDKGVFLFPGAYDVKISLAGYIEETRRIEVKQTGTNEFNFNLIKNSGALTIKVFPAGAKVLIDREDYTGRTNIELFPGKHKIEVTAKGYNSFEEVINIEIGKTTNKNINLTAKTGRLQFTVQPLEADVKLYRNNSLVEQWKGLKILGNLIEGKYRIETSCPGYENKTKEINITENKTTTEEIILEKGAAQSEQRTGGSAEENMVFVKGGWFEMGQPDPNIIYPGRTIDEQPVHRVWVNNFYIGKYEVTFAEYDKFCEATERKKPSDEGWGRGNRPVINVSWHDAKAYCEWSGGRLPTEAEWEYAAKGGAKSRGYTFSGGNDIGNVAWYLDNSGKKTHPVGRKKPNELGIYDMTGNVWEWCNDWYRSDYYGKSSKKNPNGPSGGSDRVFRGGSQGKSKELARTSCRGKVSPESASVLIGFRIVKD